MSRPSSGSKFVAVGGGGWIAVDKLSSRSNLPSRPRSVVYTRQVSAPAIVLFYLYIKVVVVAVAVAVVVVVVAAVVAVVAVVVAVTVFTRLWES